MNIQTNQICPPIPSRYFDWTAVDADTYDGSTNSPIGYGKTENEAIEDLKTMLDNPDAVNVNVNEDAPGFNPAFDN